LGFSLFGSGGIAVCLTLLPFLLLFAENKYQRSNRIRLIIKYLFRFYLSILEFLGILSIKTKGLERLQNMKGKLIICNHPSLLDVVIIMSRLNHIQCVVNNKLWTNPFVGMIVRTAGYIRNDIDPKNFLQECQEMLDRGENILIFPEGTRTVPSQQIKMRRGFANLALFSKADIQVLTLRCTPVWLIKGSNWYDIPPKRADFLLSAGPIFSHKNDCTDSPRSIRVRTLVKDIQHYYNENLKI